MFTILTTLIFGFGSCATTNGSSSPKKDFEVTSEMYEKTFTEIRALIGQLNGIISSRDYDRWTNYLTPQYIRHHSSTKVLNEFNRKFREKGHSTELKTLQDFFVYVVVPSRSNVRLDDIVFTDSNSVRAYMNVGGDRGLLYVLERDGETWKIGIE